MEKSGRILLTPQELHMFSMNELSPSLKSKGVYSLDQLKQIIDLNEFEISDGNLNNNS